MLDSFEILTTSGVVLWSKQYVSVSSNIVNALITDVFIEERIPSATKAQGDARASRNTPYKKEKYTMKWATAKDIGLIFVAVYQSMLSLSWVDDLLDVVRGIFLKEFSAELKRANKSKVDYSSFDPTFNALVAKLDKTSAENGVRPSDTESASEAQLTPPSSTTDTEDGDEAPPPPPPAPVLQRSISKHKVVEEASQSATPLATPDTSRPSSPAISHLVTGKAGPGGKLSRRAKKALSSTPASSGDESSPSRVPLGARKASGKAKRIWDADGFAVDRDDDVTLDYSQPATETDGDARAAVDDINTEEMGTRTGKGQFVLKDLDDEVNAIIAETRAKQDQKEEASGLLGSSVGAISGYFKNIVGGKTLTKQDLEKPLKNLEDHLLRKNVAREAAVRLCESVERELVGVKTANITSKNPCSSTFHMTDMICKASMQHCVLPFPRL